MELSAPLPDPDFQFPGIKFAPSPVGLEAPAAGPAAAAPADLGPLAQLQGQWTGTGFNTIWRPFQRRRNPCPKAPRTASLRSTSRPRRSRSRASTGRFRTAAC